MFDGKVSTSRVVSAISSSKRESQRDIVENARKLREKRSNDRLHRSSAIKLQKTFRGYTSRMRSIADFRIKFDQDVEKIEKIKTLLPSFKVPLNSILSLSRLYSFMSARNLDFQRLPPMLKIFYQSASSSDKDHNILYQVVGERNGKWTYHLSHICSFQMQALEQYLRHGGDDGPANFCLEALTFLSNADTTLAVMFQDLHVNGLFAAIACLPACASLRNILNHSESFNEMMDRESLKATKVRNDFVAILVAIVAKDFEGHLRQVTDLWRISSTDQRVLSGEDLSDIHLNAVEMTRWHSLCANVLAARDLQFLERLEPLLSLLANNDFFGWKLAMHIWTNQERRNSARLFSHLSLTHLIDNFCTFVLLDRITGAPTIEGLQLLRSAPLVKIASSFGGVAQPSSDTAVKAPSGDLTVKVQDILATDWKDVLFCATSTLPLVSVVRTLERGCVLPDLLKIESGLDLTQQRMEDDDEEERDSHIDGDADEASVEMAAGVRIVEVSIAIAVKKSLAKEQAQMQLDVGDVEATMRIVTHSDAVGMLLNQALDDVHTTRGLTSLAKPGKAQGRETPEGKWRRIDEGTKDGNVEMDLEKSMSEDISTVLEKHVNKLFRVCVSYSDMLMASGFGVDGSVISAVSPQNSPRTPRKSQSSGAYGKSGRLKYSKCAVGLSILNAVAFASPQFPLVRRLWDFLSGFGEECLIALLSIADDDAEASLGGVASGGNYRPSSSTAQQLSRFAETFGVSVTSLSGNVASIFHLFCASFSHQLVATDDDEFFRGSLISMEQIRDVVSVLKAWTLRIYYTQPVLGSDSSKPSSAFASTSKSWNSSSSGLPSAPAGGGVGVGSKGSPRSSCIDAKLRRLHHLWAATKVFNALFERCERRPFLDVENWQWRLINPADFALSGDLIGDERGLNALLVKSTMKSVLNCVPQVVSFDQRLQLFQAILQREREAARGADLGIMMPGNIRIHIRRDQIVRDAFDALGAIDDHRLRKRIQVEFHDEAGIDGGGLFKDFMDAFAKAAFDPQSGFFVTTSDHLLTPNPDSVFVNEEHLKYFHFFGKMLGVAMFNGMLVEPQFSGVFLNVLLGRSNHIDDLWLLDKEVHKNLMKLKELGAASNLKGSGDLIGDLGLYFVVDRSAFGATQSRELVRGGGQMLVTKENLRWYIQRYANYLLNVQTSAQCRAFLAGFRCLVPSDRIRMFSPRELQLLISGDQKPIDIADMRKHVNYNGYTDSHPYIQWFWKVVQSLSMEEQGQFLKFVTSCSRKPNLGFAHLHPKFGIQRVDAHEPWGAGTGAAKLPSASTCFNLLKLPEYESLEVLRHKLLQAITSESGFELS